MFKKYIIKFPKDIFKKEFWKSIKKAPLIARGTISVAFLTLGIYQHNMWLIGFSVLWFILNLAQSYDTYYDNK